MQYWFAPTGSIAPFRPDRFPVFIWELRKTRQGIYGFPAIDGMTGGVKVATEEFESATDPQTVAREFHAKRSQPCMRPSLRRIYPA